MYRLLDVVGDASLVVLVHNLPYEFQFLRTIYDFQPDYVSALAKRKVAKITMYDEAF